METQEMIDYIAQSKKRTLIKAYVSCKTPIAFPKAKVFGASSIL